MEMHRTWQQLSGDREIKLTFKRFEYFMQAAKDI